MKTAAKFLIAVGCLMLALCTALVIYNTSIEKNAEQQAQNSTQLILAGIGELAAVPLPLRELEAPEEQLLDDTYVFDGMEYLGVLNIQDIGRSMPVLAQCSDANLQLAPCRYTGGIKSGALVIAAHNYASHFGSISALTIGSTISFTDANNDEHLFSVELIETLGAMDIDGMCDTDWDLSLFTCTYGGVSRVTVRCMRVE